MDDDEIAHGIAHTVQHARLAVEGAGAASVTALLSGKIIRPHGGTVCVVLFHHRAVWLVPVDRVGIELVLEVRDEAHGQGVVCHLTTGGYHVEREGQGLWPE